MKRHVKLFTMVAILVLGACLPSLNKAFGIQQTLDTWVGRSIDELQIEWGFPSKRYRLENSETILLTYHRIEDRSRSNMHPICQMAGSAATSLICPRNNDECMINVAASLNGHISRVTIVRGGVLPLLGSCLELIRPAP